jgi:hypothetical protein
MASPEGRKAALLVMVAHLFFHCVMYDKSTRFVAWVHNAFRESREVWDWAGRIYECTLLAPIPRTYFHLSGATVWRRLTDLMERSSCRNGELTSTEGERLRPDRLCGILMG